MKYKKTNEFPLKEELQKLGISVRGLSSVAGVDNVYLHQVLSGTRIASEKHFCKIFSAFEKIKNDKELQKKLKDITRKTSNGKSKLTPDQKIDVISKRRTGQTLLSIAKMFNMSKQGIALIVKDDEQCQKFKYKKKIL